MMKTMRKTTTYHYTEVDVRQIIRDELKLTKEDITESITENLTQKITVFKDQIITLIDKVMGELQAIRQSNEIFTGRIYQHNDQLKNHETRITKLEQTSPPA